MADEVALNLVWGKEEGKGRRGRDRCIVKGMRSDREGKETKRLQMDMQRKKKWRKKC